MTGPSHQSLVSDQFGPRAGAYLASAVHAEGEEVVFTEKIHGKNCRIGCGTASGLC